MPLDSHSFQNLVKFYCICLFEISTALWLNNEGDGLSRESLGEDLHTTSESEDKMEGGLLLGTVLGESSSILELYTSKAEPLPAPKNINKNVLDTITQFHNNYKKSN